MYRSAVMTLIDLSFSITIPIVEFPGYEYVIGFIGIMFLYWIVKAIVSVIVGG